MGTTSDDELPELSTLLPRPRLSTVVQRSSPRKVQQSSVITNRETSSNFCLTARQTRASPTKPKQATTVKKVSRSTPQALSLGNVPILPRYGSGTEISASSNNSLARSPPMRSIGLTHVDSVQLSLSKLCLDGSARPKQPKSGSRGLAVAKSSGADGKKQTSKTSSSQNQSRSTTSTQKFILNEAACADDPEDSLVETDDEDTDLSGFVVDDDVEPSIHESSSDSEVDRRLNRNSSSSPRKRRLQRGPRDRKDAENIAHDTVWGGIRKATDSLADAFRDLKIEQGNGTKPARDIEIVDLTSSPIRTHDDGCEANVNTEEISNTSIKFRGSGNPINLFNDFDNMLKLSPPCSNDPEVSKSKVKMESPGSEREQGNGEGMGEKNVRDGFATPPATPPRSPSKLKSPSKLLSPSKRAAQVQHSPHRQSIDGFWDLEVVNTWHDTYSPKKAPITSPRKNRFLEWMDSGDEDDETPTEFLHNNSDSFPSPCSSPRKSRSPQRSPEKAEKERAREEKRLAKAKKEDFELRKEQLATSLMIDLDTNITSSRLSALSSSTGGVQIIWSKTLRSTAGRANWRRTVVKPTGSPVEGSSIPAGSIVQHYASIELATKVIDCESRLVNTLVHEFCHLANFMVSNVRDQPHGASFKAWASNVTNYLRAHDNPMYRGVEVTTKHSYTIDHKYLWVCAGREALNLLKNVPEAEDGCGAEYGRHSKSIDPEKHRCGRCKGMLLQVRPKPRRIDPTRASPRKTLFQKKPVESVTEAVEVVDLSD
jgi:predicted SprT family Zn-dependent metalloprotease